MKTIEFILSDPIEFQTGGEHAEGKTLELTAPAVNNRKRVAKLKQGLMRCINDLQTNESVKKESKPDSSDIKPEEILVLLQMGSVEYDEYMDIFVNLLTSGVCKVEGKEPMTSTLVEKMSFADLEKLMGEYLVNFTIGSLGN